MAENGFAGREEPAFLPDAEDAGPWLFPEEIAGAIPALRLIFWGGLLCLFDLTVSQRVEINGRVSGWRFDLLNDLLGNILIAWGVCRLAGVEVHRGYRRAMVFVSAVALLSLPDALQEHFLYEQPAALSFLLALLGLVQLVAIPFFCQAMCWFCLAGGLMRSAPSWRTTLWLFLLLLVVPLGLFYLAALAAFVGRFSFHFQLGPAGLLLLPVFFVPLVHFFVSTSRMKREAEEGGLPD